jgi:membrane protein implicated in regulation of membrane protease activity
MGLIVVLAVALGVIVADIGTDGGFVPWFAAAVWLFAVAEYVNYFHLQLSYQNAADLRRLVRRGRLVPAHLGRELARAVS